MEAGHAKFVNKVDFKKLFLLLNNKNEEFLSGSIIPEILDYSSSIEDLHFSNLQTYFADFTGHIKINLLRSESYVFLGSIFKNNVLLNSKTDLGCYFELNTFENNT